MRIPHLSVRARLALWHTAILAALIASSAIVSVIFLRRSNQARTDSDLADTWSAFGSELAAERRELPTLKAASAEALNEFRFNNVAVVVFDSERRIVGIKPLASDKSGDNSAPGFDAASVASALGAGFGKTTVVVTLPDREGGYRVYSSPMVVSGDRATVVAARSLHQEDEALEEAGTAFAIVAPLVLAFAFLGGWFLAGRSLAPVGAMSERAARIGASNTGERLPVVNAEDELGMLATVLNDLLDRLAEALDQQRRFMTEASHELRTPVAVVRAIADVILSKGGRTDSEYREALETVHREARRLSRVVEDLFLLSRADIGERPIRHQSLYLGEVISDAAGDLAPLARERGITIDCALPEDGCPYEGDEELLDRVFGNLIDNAIKYGPAGSKIFITLADLGSEYRVTVEDNGPGIPEHLREKIFQRFFRAGDDDASVGGAGLGLSIAKWVVEAHGGRIGVSDGKTPGATFSVLLPKLGAGTRAG